VATHPERVK
jgi:6-phosphofructokinase 1